MAGRRAMRPDLRSQRRFGTAHQPVVEEDDRGERETRQGMAW